MASPAIKSRLQKAAEFKGVVLSNHTYRDGVGSTKILAKWRLSETLLESLRRKHHFLWENGNGVKLFDPMLLDRPFDFYFAYDSQIGLCIELVGHHEGVILRLKIVGYNDGPEDRCAHVRLSKALLDLYPKARGIPPVFWEILKADGCELLIPYVDLMKNGKKKKK